MGLLNWLRGKQDDGDDQGSNMPWDRHPSIYEHINAHIDPQKPGLTEGGSDLPDEKKEKIRWAPGALDGVFGHHSSPGEAEEKVQQLLGQIAAYCQAPTVEHKLAVYQSLQDDSVLGIIDVLMRKLQEAETFGSSLRLVPGLLP